MCVLSQDSQNNSNNSSKFIFEENPIVFSVTLLTSIITHVSVHGLLTAGFTHSPFKSVVFELLGLGSGLIVGASAYVEGHMSGDAYAALRIKSFTAAMSITELGVYIATLGYFYHKETKISTESQVKETKISTEIQVGALLGGQLLGATGYVIATECNNFVNYVKSNFFEVPSNIDATDSMKLAGSASTTDFMVTEEHH